jgi:hypothetical protein
MCGLDPMMDAVEQRYANWASRLLISIPSVTSLDRSTTMRRLYADQLVVVTAILIVLLSAFFVLLQAR